MSFIFMEDLLMPWSEQQEPSLEESQDDGSLLLGRVQAPANVDILTGYEIMVRQLNVIVRQHETFKWDLLYGLYYG